MATLFGLMLVDGGFFALGFGMVFGEFCAQFFVDMAAVACGSSLACCLPSVAFTCSPACSEPGCVRICCGICVFLLLCVGRVVFSLVCFDWLALCCRVRASVLLACLLLPSRLCRRMFGLFVFLCCVLLLRRFYAQAQWA